MAGTGGTVLILNLNVVLRCITAEWSATRAGVLQAPVSNIEGGIGPLSFKS